MTTWALTDARPARDVLDDLYPGRARRSAASLGQYPHVEKLAQGRYSTRGYDGERSDWVVVTGTGDGATVVKADPGEHVEDAQALLARQTRGRAA